MNGMNRYFEAVWEHFFLFVANNSSKAIKEIFQLLMHSFDNHFDRPFISTYGLDYDNNDKIQLSCPIKTAHIIGLHKSASHQKWHMPYDTIVVFIHLDFQQQS